MKTHPYIPAWQSIMDHTGLRARDICKASGVAEGSFSKYMNGHLWPSRKAIARVHRGLECLLNKQEFAVDKFVDNLLLTAGKVGAKLFEDVGGPVSPQLVPTLVHRPARPKNEAHAAPR